MKYQSLHGHSVLSDGVMTHEQILDECQKNNIGVVAVTDHDTLIKPEIFEKIKNLNHLVKFVSGIEMSADFVPEVKGNLSTFHITGLFVDPTNKNIVDFCRELQEGRRRRLKKYVEKLTARGFKITEEEVLKCAGDGGTIGRPHIVNAMKQNPENIKLINEMYLKLQETAKTDEVRLEQLKDIDSRPNEFKEWQKWFGLVMTPEGMFSAHVEYSETGERLISLDDVVKVIRGAGGLAMIAHWSYLREKYPFNYEIVEKLLKESRLDGMETVYSFGIEGEKRQAFVDDMMELSRLCKKYNMVEGGGMDFHKPEDIAIALDPNFKDFSERTIGMVEKILEHHPNVDKTWTTL
ncbi:MAG: PHP domain-containing protein [bacterium]|nr:PHP domain-containing protein [bacterium]